MLGHISVFYSVRTAGLQIKTHSYNCTNWQSNYNDTTEPYLLLTEVKNGIEVYKTEVVSVDILIHLNLEDQFPTANDFSVTCREVPIVL